MMQEIIADNRQALKLFLSRALEQCDVSTLLYVRRGVRMCGSKVKMSTNQV